MRVCRSTLLVIKQLEPAISQDCACYFLPVEGCMGSQANDPRSICMRTFTIDNQDNIMAFASASEAGADPRFSTAAELLKLASSWPTSRLVEIRNSLTGVVPVRRFTDRNTAVSRIWKAIQRLDSTPAQAKSSRAKTGSKRAKPASAGAAGPARTNSKKAQGLGLLQRPEGVTLRGL